jgi:hypothetical protein
MKLLLENWQRFLQEQEKPKKKPCKPIKCSEGMKPVYREDGCIDYCEEITTPLIKTGLKNQYLIKMLAFVDDKDSPAFQKSFSKFINNMWTLAEKYDNFTEIHAFDDKKKKTKPTKKIPIAFYAGPEEKKAMAKNKNLLKFYILKCEAGGPPARCKSYLIRKPIKVRRNAKLFFKVLIRQLKKFEKSK